MKLLVFWFMLMSQDLSTFTISKEIFLCFIIHKRILYSHCSWISLHFLNYANELQVKAFILEPGALTQEPNREGIIDCDGEVLARGKGTYQCDQKSLMSYDKLQITVDQGLATLFSPV